MACITPLHIKNKITEQYITVPCSKCPECMKRRVSSWSFRLIQEDKVSESALFLTLTYDTMKVPITKNGYMSLCKRDVQLFMKRLRFAHSKENKLKYYACGEYGGKTNRPHYHMILFNAKVELIQNAWGLGHVHYGSVSEASVGYTLKYMVKPSRIPMHKNDDRVPEFPLMSKGLGKSYLSEATIQYHKNDLINRLCHTVSDGKKVAMSRYYKDKIYTEVERKKIADHYKNNQPVEVMTEQQLLEAHKAAFRKMNTQSQKGRDKL